MLARTPAGAPTGADSPSSSGERVYKRGYTPELRGTVEAFLAKDGWVEVIWDKPTRNHPRVCHLNELVKVSS